MVTPSYAIGAHPQPPLFGDADWRDEDVYGLDCSANMALRNDYIAACSLAQIQRTDGASLQSGDLAVSSVTVLASGISINCPDGTTTITGQGNFVSFMGSGGLPGSGYLVTLEMTLASGLSINRTCEIDTPPYVG